MQLNNDELLAAIDAQIVRRRQDLADHEARTAKKVAMIRAAGGNPDGTYISAANRGDRIRRLIRKAETLRTQFIKANGMHRAD